MSSVNVIRPCWNFASTPIRRRLLRATKSAYNELEWCDCDIFSAQFYSKTSGVVNTPRKSALLFLGPALNDTIRHKPYRQEGPYIVDAIPPQMLKASFFSNVLRPIPRHNNNTSLVWNNKYWETLLKNSRTLVDHRPDDSNWNVQLEKGRKNRKKHELTMYVYARNNWEG